MRTVAKLQPMDRRALFTNAASKTGLTAAIIEKDFWVCWTLDYLFHRNKWKNSLVFKGGTSLSKAFALIERFSEDIDLILDWRALGYGIDEPWKKRSRTGQERFNKEAGERTIAYLHDVFIPVMQAEIRSELNTEVMIEQDSDDEQTILFIYPQVFSSQDILQAIRLEIGALAVWTPSAYKVITPYATEHYAHLFSNPTTSVLTVLPERTFWEKATILHHEANRPQTSLMPARYSRHYYDMYCLSRSWVKSAALSNLGLLEKVVAFKDKFYPRSWACYTDAKPGSIKLVPPPHCLKELEADYEHMQGMIFGVKPSFQEIMSVVNNLEIEINGL